MYSFEIYFHFMYLQHFRKTRQAYVNFNKIINFDKTVTFESLFTNEILENITNLIQMYFINLKLKDFYNVMRVNITFCIQ